MKFVNAIVNVNNPKGRSDQKHLPTAHDNILLYATDGAVSYGWRPQDKVLKRYNKQDGSGKYREIDLRKTGDNDLATDRPKMAYSFAYNEENDHLIVLSSEEDIPNEYIEIKPMKTLEIKGRWRWEQNTAKENINRLLAKYQPNKQQWSIFEKDYLGDNEKVFPTSVWDEKPFNSERGTEIFTNLGFSKEDFPRPKPVGLLTYLLEHLCNSTALTLDYFAGSGTTAHAVINLNREDGGKRKYILVEQGEYFDTVLKPRVQKVIYSENWKDGKPQADKDGDLHGVPQIVKVLQLESYEDTLNNLTLVRQDNVFDHLPEAAQRDYLLRYMLTHESRDSLLSTDDFKHPFAYRLNIATSSAGSYESRVIDLVETFNYLLGISVQAVDDQRHDPRRQFVFIEGRLPNGENCLIVWRDCERWDYQQLPELLKKRRINPNNHEFDVIYINGDHNIPTVLQEADGIKTLKLRPIEPEFLSLMFDVEDV